MKRLALIIFFMGLFSLMGFGQNLKNNATEADSSKKLTQLQLDELYKLTEYGIDLIKDSYIQSGSFLPIGFSLSVKNEFKLIVYEEPSENGELLTDYVYNKVSGIVEGEFKNANIRIACVIYNGILKNVKYPNGIDCISFKFKSKELTNDILISYAVKSDNGELLYGYTDVQIIN